MWSLTTTITVSPPSRMSWKQVQNEMVLSSPVCGEPPVAGSSVISAAPPEPLSPVVPPVVLLDEDVSTEEELDVVLEEEVLDEDELESFLIVNDMSVDPE